MKGSGEGNGLSEVTRLGGDMETAARFRRLGHRRIADRRTGRWSGTAADPLGRRAHGRWSCDADRRRSCAKTITPTRRSPTDARRWKRTSRQAERVGLRSLGLCRSCARRHDLPSRLCRVGTGTATHDDGDAEHRHRSKDPGRGRTTAICLRHGLETIDVIDAADHQFPWQDGPRSPRDVKAELDKRPAPAWRDCIETLVQATIAAMRPLPQPSAGRSHICSASCRRLDYPRIRCRTDLLAELASAAAATDTTGRDQRTLALPVAANTARRCGLPARQSCAAPTAMLRGNRPARTTSVRRCRRLRHDGVVRWIQPSDALPDPLDHAGTAQRRHRRLMILLACTAVGLTALAVGGVLLPPERRQGYFSRPVRWPASTSARFRSPRRSSQFVAVGLNRFYIGYERLRPFYPRVAVVVPAWNEGHVIGATIERLLAMDYPSANIRVYVVDDASTDATPDVVRAMGGTRAGPRAPPSPGTRRAG